MLKSRLSLVLSLLILCSAVLCGCQSGQAAIAENSAPETAAEATSEPAETAAVPEAAQNPYAGSKYSDYDNWVYLEASIGGKAADVFFLSPTCFNGKEEGLNNMPLDNEELREKFAIQPAREKGIYDDNCRFFAPYYSQVGMNVYNTMSVEEREPYLQTAFEDVKEAFEYYMAYYNEGRPVVIAGFSQGADMSLRLLKECFKSEERQAQLVACYAIGWRITQEELEQYPHLKFAQGETDTGVIISFNTEAQGVESSLMIPEGVKALAINPLSWKTDGTVAPRRLNSGACFVDNTGSIKEEVPQYTGAYIDVERGCLRVTDVTKDSFPGKDSVFEKGVFHSYDYQFFYRNLEKNVQDRIQAFLAKRSL